MVASGWATEQIKAGVLETASTTNKREDLFHSLGEFWDFDNSKYVRGKIARGGMISRAYCRIMKAMVGKYVKPAFEGRTITSLTTEVFNDWMASLS